MRIWRSTLLLALAVATVTASAQEATVRGTVSVTHTAKNVRGSGDAVIWLTPLYPSEPVAPGPKARLAQKDKRFVPHVLVVTVGTQIEFPNQDPYFHNVFSIYRGKPFDLGLYESGGVRTFRFTQPGVSYIFCNIHPEMSAAVIALKTKYFALTGEDGSFQIAHVPPGRYRMEVWHERAAEKALAALTREITVTTGDNQLGTIALQATEAPGEHLNKYGEPYPKPKKDKY